MDTYKQKPLLSVRLMTYNHEKFIHQAMESILSQKVDFPVEVVVGDDFSTDNTLSIIRKFKSTKSIHIHILERAKGDEYWKKRQAQGRIYNFINILENCKGKYIALLDGDDYWTDTLKLQKQVDFLEANPDYVICCDNAKIINENGEHIQDKKLPYLTEDRDYTSFELQQGAFLLTMSLLFRNVGVVFPKEFNGVLNGDKVLISLLGNYGKGRYIENIIPAVYRVHSGGVWSSLKEFNQRLVKRKLNYAFMKYYQENEELYSFFYNEQRELSIYLMKNIKEAESFKSYLDFNLFYIRFNSVFSSKKKLKKFLRLSKRYWVS